MTQAIVSPEELEGFARDLQRFNGELRTSTRRVNAQFQRLGETWRDQEHRKFAQEYEKTMRQIEVFLQVSDQQIPFLQRKAQRAREYLQQR